MSATRINATQIIDTSTAADALTAATGITISNFRFVCWGRVAMLIFRAAPSAAKSGTWDIGTMKSAFRPTLEAGVVTGNASHTAWITAEGAIRYSGSISAGSYASIKVTYLIA